MVFISFAWVLMSCQSLSLYCIPIQTLNHHLADCRKFAFVFHKNTEATGDYFWVLSLFPFSQGQKPGLTDVQAELDRMTRKQDSVVSANNIPPTENEA